MFVYGIMFDIKNKNMTENTNQNTENTAESTSAKATADSKTAGKVVEKYPAMAFVAKFARLVATIMAFAFMFFALLSIGMGIFTDASFLWGLINAGFYLLIGSVCVGLVRGAGEVFELLLDIEKRK